MGNLQDIINLSKADLSAKANLNNLVKLKYL